ncbi:hypothetical protein D3C80_2109130 [compost metagenome]
MYVFRVRIISVCAWLPEYLRCSVICMDSIRIPSMVSARVSFFNSSKILECGRKCWSLSSMTDWYSWVIN